MTTIQTPASADTDAFVRARPRLLGVARRVLTNPHDADDVVQDAWMRWQSTDRRAVRDPVAFLTTTTTRLALNAGQCARARWETVTEPQRIEAAEGTGDPALGVERRQTLEQALHTVLEFLTPAERGVFLLREAFDYPYARIADALGLTEANTRQLALRARRHLAGRPRQPVAAGEHRSLVEAFVIAGDTGHMVALEALLAERARTPHADPRRPSGSVPGPASDPLALDPLSPITAPDRRWFRPAHGGV